MMNPYIGALVTSLQEVKPGGILNYEPRIALTLTAYLKTYLNIRFGILIMLLPVESCTELSGQDWQE